MKNEFNKTNFIQDEILLHEANFQAKKCNSFHFSTISFNNFQIKLIILVALFIILIFNSNNSYAFTDDFDFDYSSINDKLGTNFQTSFIETLLPTIKNTTNNYNFYKSCSNVIIMYDTTLNANRKHTLYIIFTPIKNVSIYQNSDFLFNNSNNYLYFMRCTLNINDDFTIFSSSVSQPSTTLQSNNLINYKTISSSYYFDDIVNGTIFYDENIFYNNSFIGIQEEGGGDIDMTEVTNAIDTNSNIQILILFFLISMFVYLIFYTVANSGRRNK